MVKEAVKEKKGSPQDVEMKDADSVPNGDVPEKGKKETDQLTLEDIREQVKLIEKGVNGKEPRFVSRVLWSFSATRRRLNHSVLRRLINAYFPSTNMAAKEALQQYLDEPMDTESHASTPSSSVSTPSTRPRSSRPPPTYVPEVEVYIQLLVVVHLIDTKRLDDALQCSESLVQKIIGLNRRSMDALAAKSLFYHARVYELMGQLSQVRSFLNSRLRTSTIHVDSHSQAMLLNLLLRNYLHYNLYDQAAKLVSKSTFPETANNNEWARFLYYIGRIKAIQLEYSAAHGHLTEALRKAPTSAAVGFKQTVSKLAITVELLLGEIPERSQFISPAMKRSLAPYFQLTQAVRTGNLAKFNEVLEKYGDRFQADNTWTLIIRLRHNVIKTGVRMISLSYSRISLADIAQKLQLDSPEDAEFIVAKAIRDGVIEATIDHEKGYVQSKENTDIYSTREPQLAFHQRISFCLDIHNQSVKAMRFPPKSYSKDLESAEEQRERERQDLELAKEIADDEDDF
ncbi:26S proteasome non-ATPase regulatory subunit 3-like [Branchiostoma floridae]|uniref:26S proteasome regulatory subunit RPN3 n=1 Tax=Branchiostoma floridae TaxID=7739 RepID=C3Z8E0_BRAFL|nr:26S proteasome non-ATPase regulatory subunit 3-like [Branchiostoma floridae]|eukprot:XP_002595252.1 hypothetical protein BRAFLDRAFT_268075 [Branchiostoma floridae]